MMQDYRRRRADDRYTEILDHVQLSQVEVFWKITAKSELLQEEKKQLILPHIRHLIETQSYEVLDFSADELCERLYNDTQAYSILTRPLEDPFVEGIHVNAWNNVRLQFINGQSAKIDGFLSPQHAIDVIRKLLQESNQVLDDAMPVAEASLGSNVRITTVKTPIVDEDVGVACYIRKLSTRIFREDDYLSGDFASRKEIRMLQTALRRGASVLLVGKVNTGKTTFLAYLLSTLPDDFEIITIEGGAREINLVKRKDDGEIINNALHMLTHESRDERLSVTQELLFQTDLRFNPDVTGMAEMRNLEACAAVEASMSGHVVISTTHAGSAQQAHKRIANLCRKKYAMDFATALDQACEAFPIVAFLHTLEDHKRRIMAVTECYVEEGKPVYRPLWRYEIRENYRQEDGTIVIRGGHRQLNNLSPQMLERMKMYGISPEEIVEMEMMPKENVLCKS